MTSILKITDGDSQVDLLGLREGVSALGWRQAVAEYKGGGTFQQSSLSDGRRLVDKRFANTTENFPIPAIGQANSSQDVTISILHRLFALMEKASDYWVDKWRNEPVWLESRADCETNTRYAIVSLARIPQIADLYAPASFNNDAVLNDMALTVERGQWTETRPGTGTAVELSAVETYDGRNLGNVNSAGVRTPTTANQVYVGNKRNEANLTDIYTWSAANGFSANLMDAALPFDLIDDVGVAPQINDYIAFGVDTALADSGPFMSLVFDIGTAQTGHTLTWEYWNGAWVALPTHDNTATAQPLDTTGVSSVHWSPLASLLAIDWVALALNGITAYWVRLRVTAVPGPLVTPIQQNRDAYSIVWPYTEVQAGEIPGNLAAQAQIELAVQSHEDGGGATVDALYFNRLVAGLRTVERGSDFTAYLNAADEQNPVGLTVTLTAASGATTFQTAPEAPSGRAVRFSNLFVIPMDDRIIFSFDTSLAPHYYGTHRAFVRYSSAVGAPPGTFLTELRVTYGAGGGDIIQPEQFSTADGEWVIIDFGKIDIPGRGAITTSDAMTFEIAIRAEITVAVVSVLFYDLILIPMDEWAADLTDVVNDADSTIEEGRLLDIDSLVNPKAFLRALSRDVSTNEVTGNYLAVKNGPAMLHQASQQRLWCLAMRSDGAGSSRWLSEGAIASKIQINRNAQYLGPRGAA